MRVLNMAGRTHLLVEEGLVVDVFEASNGRWGADPQGVFADWDNFRHWAEQVSSERGRPYDPARLEAPVPRPRQILAIGLNYRDHADESGFQTPSEPSVFTKFPASLAGPQATVRLPEGDVDWEVEMVLVIGRKAYQVCESDAWSYVAGVTVGQDLSERRSQLAGPVPQFSLAKSHVGFGPIGPVVVTPDELPNYDDLELGCTLNGELVQKGRTRDMVFDVPTLIARLSKVTPLFPGDLVFTGTPPGVGMGRKPPRYIKPGDELVSYVEGVGEMRTVFVADSSSWQGK